MQVRRNWMSFSYKSPYSAIPGRPLPEDFKVIVAMKVSNEIDYVIMKASIATDFYNMRPDLAIAWKALEEYVI